MGGAAPGEARLSAVRADLLVLVPARGGSKRLPGKNLRPLAGRSLLAHTAEAIAASGLAAPVLLTTDDAAIAAEGQRIGWQVPFLRPAALAGDAAPTVGAVLHALDWWRATHGADPAAVMVLQPTSPLRGGACLRRAVALLDEHPLHDSVVAVDALHVAAGHVYVPTSDGGMAPLAGTDGRRPVYVPNGALYLTRVAALRRDETLYAGPILPLPLAPPRGLDVDTEDDWFMADALIAALAARPAGSAP
ncbi:MAG: acylneuraminate cytidylyltransferase family protein [Alphaproteobacteria bacterium]